MGCQPKNRFPDQLPVALLAGGLATRLRPLTENIPKVLVEVAGRPFLDHQLALLRANGFRRVVLCLGYLGELVTRHLGDGARHGLEVAYSYDGARMLGTGGALRRAAPQLGEEFWVMYGDSYMDVDYEAVLRDHRKQGKLGLMTVIANQNRWDRSNVLFQDARILCYDKRHPTAPMAHIDYGAAILHRKALERIPEGQPYDLADLYHGLVKDGQMGGHEVTHRFYEIGSPTGLAETQAYIRSRAR